jgi:hypothetical protein
MDGGILRSQTVISSCPQHGTRSSCGKEESFPDFDRAYRAVNPADSRSEGHAGDKDLADLYGVETRTLTQAVRRNITRFPDDFMFQLSKQEFDVLRSQFGASSQWGGRRYPPADAAPNAQGAPPDRIPRPEEQEERGVTHVSDPQFPFGKTMPGRIGTTRAQPPGHARNSSKIE